MTTAKELREQRAALVQELNDIAAKVSEEERNFSPEEQERWDKIDNDQKALQERAETIERVEKARALVAPEVKAERVARNATVTERDADNALRCWALRSAGHDHLIKEEWRDAGERCGIQHGVLNVKLNKRAQTFGTDNQGGYTVDGAVVQGIEKSLLYFGGVREVATTIRTENGAPIAWATNNDSGNVGAIVAENTQVSDTATTFGQVTLDAYKFSSLIQPVSLELLQDSGIDLGAYLAEILGERLARVHNTYFTTGTGSSQPQGVVTGSAAGKTAASETAITYGELVDLYHSVDIAYRNSPKFAFMMADSTFATLRKLVDSNGLPMWGVGLNGAEEDTLLGRKVVINNDVAAIEESAKVILCGDFSKYLVRDVMNIQIRVLNERYADYGAVGFIAFSRNDGVVLNSGAIKHLVMKAAA